jgi:hypothetical protein
MTVHLMTVRMMRLGRMEKIAKGEAFLEHCLACEAEGGAKRVGGVSAIWGEAPE